MNIIVEERLKSIIDFFERKSIMASGTMLILVYIFYSL